MRASIRLIASAITLSVGVIMLNIIAEAIRLIEARVSYLLWCYMVVCVCLSP